jgi:hypothetical protein
VVMEEQFCRRSFSLDKSPGCPIEASPAPGVFVDSRRESTNRIGMHPHPGYFGKRGCKFLILKDGSAKKREKRLQKSDSEGVSPAGRCGGRVSCRGNMREGIISVYRLSSTFSEGSVSSVRARKHQGTFSLRMTKFTQCCHLKVHLRVLSACRASVAR